MTAIVVPYRDADPKRRLRLSDDARRRLAAAMLADVVEAASAVGRVFVVASSRPPLPAGADLQIVADPLRGQGAAVRKGLDVVAAASGSTSMQPTLVVNADLPCVTPRDLLALAGAVPAGGLAVAAAADGTTNALGLSDERVFTPLYGPGSAARYAALGESRLIDAPNLVDDVDTLTDLIRVAPRLGSHTLRALVSLRLVAAA
jgi:2-phospho-L-lactate guanylyltransferase